MIDDPTNEERAESAKFAMENSLKYASGYEEDVIELMTDLLHYAQQEGHDVEQILRMVNENYKTEISGE